VPEPVSLPTGVTLRTDVRRYPVRGMTRGALGASLEDAAPRADGRKVWGRTDWRLAPEYRYGFVEDRCAVIDARVGVEVTVLLPLWQDRERATLDLRRRWEAFMAALVTHELGHRARAVEAGAALRAALLETRASSCDAIEARVEARARGIMDEWADRQVSYDEETRRGRSQGARWPP